MEQAMAKGDDILGLVYAFAALLSFSLSPVLYKVGLGNRNLHVIEANTLRAWGSLLLLTPMLVVSRALGIYLNNALFFIILSAILGPIIGDTLFMYSIRGVGVSIATPIANSYSLIVTAISIIFFGEKLTLINAIGGFLIILSLWVLYFERKKLSKEAIAGMAASLGTAFMWSLSIISMKQALAMNVNPVLIIFLRTLIVALLLSLVSKMLKFSFKEKLDLKTSITLSIGGFFGIGFGVIMLLYAIEALGTGRASLIASASPVMASILAILLLKEKLRIRAVIASILVAVGAVLLK